jgi:hypothetical protein
MQYDQSIKTVKQEICCLKKGNNKSFLLTDINEMKTYFMNSF